LEEKERLLPGFEGEIIHLGFLNLDSAHSQRDLCHHLSLNLLLFLIGTGTYFRAYLQRRDSIMVRSVILSVYGVVPTEEVKLFHLDWQKILVMKGQNFPRIKLL
jgi:hypothetical protein